MPSNYTSSRTGQTYAPVPTYNYRSAGGTRSSLPASSINDAMQAILEGQNGGGYTPYPSGENNMPTSVYRDTPVWNPTPNGENGMPTTNYGPGSPAPAGYTQAEWDAMPTTQQITVRGRPVNTGRSGQSGPYFPPTITTTLPNLYDAGSRAAAAGASPYQLAGNQFSTRAANAAEMAYQAQPGNPNRTDMDREHSGLLSPDNPIQESSATISPQQALAHQALQLIQKSWGPTQFNNASPGNNSAKLLANIQGPTRISANAAWSSAGRPATYQLPSPSNIAGLTPEMLAAFTSVYGNMFGGASGTPRLLTQAQPAAPTAPRLLTGVRTPPVIGGNY